jgi:hypothetical protein
VQQCETDPVRRPEIHIHTAVDKHSVFVLLRTPPEYRAY